LKVTVIFPLEKIPRHVIIFILPTRPRYNTLKRSGYHEKINPLQSGRGQFVDKARFGITLGGLFALISVNKNKGRRKI